MTTGTWGFRGYRDHLAARFPGLRVRKLCLQAGFSCPNLDGTVARGGCAWCDNRGFSPGLGLPQWWYTVWLPLLSALIVLRLVLLALNRRRGSKA